jgi:hypothetical protein
VTKKKAIKTVKNLAELARLEGVARSSVTRWDQSGAVAWTDDTPPRIDVAGTRALVREYAAPTAKTDTKLAALRARNLGVEIRIRELRLKQRSGELLEKSEVDFSMRDIFSQLRQAFRSYVPKLVTTANGCDGSRAAMNRVDDQIEEMLYQVYVLFFIKLSGEENPGEVRRMIRKAWASFGIPGWEEHLEKQIKENPETVAMIRDANKTDALTKGAKNAKEKAE